MKKVLILVAASASLLLAGCGSESTDNVTESFSVTKTYDLNSGNSNGNVKTVATFTSTSSTNRYDVNVANDDALAIATQFKAIASEIALVITQQGVNFFNGQPYETAQGCNQNYWGQMEHDNGLNPTAKVSISGIDCRDDKGSEFFTMQPTGNGYPVNGAQSVVAHNTITFNTQNVALLNDGDAGVAAVVKYNSKFYLFKTANNGAELQVVDQTLVTPYYQGNKSEKQVNSVNFWKDGFAQTAADDVVIKIDLVNL
ncbi:hypothetical protein [Shewanella sp. Isolate11]|uniref:hypothetical protein n=1 Tax=Shewanella sp. Isolate11 TaxID=2908530 RepID=UPI001EFE4121|nr:hypothetical protein [Shewanella sp. Isolate11]MCG9696923.1 hypothetical protein [Shewanella sp. Isolate11]